MSSCKATNANEVRFHEHSNEELADALDELGIPRNKNEYAPGVDCELHQVGRMWLVVSALNEVREKLATAEAERQSMRRGELTKAEAGAVALEEQAKRIEQGAHRGAAKDEAPRGGHVTEGG